MPLIRVSLRRGKSAAYKAAILEGIYAGMRATFAVPEHDRFMTISEHDADDFLYSPDYMGIERSDGLAIIQLTVSNTRSDDQKRALYRAICDNLSASPGLRPEDVFINLVEVMPVNWSFGHGIAQYVPGDASR